MHNYVNNPCRNYQRCFTIKNQTQLTSFSDNENFLTLPYTQLRETVPAKFKRANFSVSDCPVCLPAAAGGREWGGGRDIDVGMCSVRRNESSSYVM